MSWPLRPALFFYFCKRGMHVLRVQKCFMIEYDKQNIIAYISGYDEKLNFVGIELYAFAPVEYTATILYVII